MTIWSTWGWCVLLLGHPDTDVCVLPSWIVALKNFSPLTLEPSGVYQEFIRSLSAVFPSCHQRHLSPDAAIWLFLQDIWWTDVCTHVPSVELMQSQPPLWQCMTAGLPCTFIIGLRGFQVLVASLWVSWCCPVLHAWGSLLDVWPVLVPPDVFLSVSSE